MEAPKPPPAITSRKVAGSRPRRGSPAIWPVWSTRAAGAAAHGAGRGPGGGGGGGGGGEPGQEGGVPRRGGRARRPRAAIKNERGRAERGPPRREGDQADEDQGRVHAASVHGEGVGAL